MNKANTQPGTFAMGLVRLLRGGLLTVPADVRKRLKLKDGDYLDLQIENGTLTLRPVAVIDREKAWDRLMAIVERDKWIWTEPRPSPEEEERWIFETLAEEDEHHHA
jgi:AbrB family looped-hinge helix DNA binding protein